MDAVDWFLGMNADHLGSNRVTQDVLLLCGENDAFQPPVLMRAQVGALIGARSPGLPDGQPRPRVPHGDHLAPRAGPLTEPHT